ncbi:MAG TPA: hypothetical protein VGN16_07830 [Acidobacteriaceae bacterium]
MITVAAKHLVAMKQLGVFLHRFTAPHNGEFTNVFAEHSDQALPEREIETIRTVLASALIGKYHDKFEVVISPSVTVTPEELHNGAGIVTQ